MSDRHQGATEDDQQADDIQRCAAGCAHHVEIGRAVQDIKDRTLLDFEPGKGAITIGQSEKTGLHIIRAGGVTEAAIPAIIQSHDRVTGDLRSQGAL